MKHYIGNPRFRSKFDTTPADEVLAKINSYVSPKSSTSTNVSDGGIILDIDIDKAKSFRDGIKNDIGFDDCGLVKYGVNDSDLWTFPNACYGILEAVLGNMSEVSSIYEAIDNCMDFTSISNDTISSASYALLNCAGSFRKLCLESKK